MNLVSWEMDRVPSHDDLSMAALEAFARSVRRVLRDAKLPDDQQRKLAEEIVWDIASIFEDGRLTLGGKRFRPALRFLTELREPVPVTATGSLRDYVDGMVEQAFDEDPDHGYPRKM